jgi:small subunit ribosomal protein S24e
MDIDIIDEEENPMLHRTDVRFAVTHEEATPSRLSVRDSLAAMLNKDAGEVVVHELDTKFGMRETVGYAKVYDTPEHARNVEQDHMLQRNKIGGDGEAEPAPAEEDDEDATDDGAATDDEAAEAADEPEAGDETADDEEAAEAEEA